MCEKNEEIHVLPANMIKGCLLEEGQEVLVAHPCDNDRTVKAVIKYINREHHWFLAELKSDSGKYMLRQAYHFLDNASKSVYK